MNQIVIQNWSISDTPTYILLALLLAFIVRVTAVVMKAMQYSEDFKSMPRAAWDAFVGFKVENGEPDRWFPYVLGVLEFLIYPFLMASGLWAGIGAWIALKTLAQWGEWKDQRSTFNRFLIGNALVFVLAFLVLTPKVCVSLAGS